MPREPSSRFRAVVFDLDGTLLDTLNSIAGAFNRSLSKMGLPGHEIDAYRHFIGDGVFRCAERCLPVALRDDRHIEELVRLERQDYAVTWKQDTAPYPGITDLLKTLQSLGIPVNVLSNKDDPFTRRCVRHFFPDIHFHCVIGYSENVPHKPDPAGCRLIVQRLGLTPEDMILVGDTRMDMETARACNMPSVGVLWGFRDLDELQEAGAGRIIRHPAELLKRLM